MSEKDLNVELFMFDKPLTSRPGKKYVECLALSILQCCYKDVYDEFEVCDAPDIRDRNGIVGIEVTEAITDADAQIRGEFVKYRLESNREKKERRKQLIEDKGAKVAEGMLSYPVIDSQIEILTIQNAITKKMEKLAEYKKKGFQKLGLFVFYNDIPIPMKLEHWKARFDEVLCKYTEKYDVIFFGYSCGLIEYNVRQNDIQVRRIDRSVYNGIKYNTRLKIEKQE